MTLVLKYKNYIQEERNKMAVRKDFTTKSGLTLPLLNLKGKEYLLIADRIRWFVTENERFEIDTSFITLDDNKAVAKTTVTVYHADGSVKTRVNGIKSETKGDFSDFAEKATTGSLGRAITYLGYGTQFSADELNELVNESGKEVNRLADAPTAPPASASAGAGNAALTSSTQLPLGAVQSTTSPYKKSTFSKKKTETSPAALATNAAPSPAAQAGDDGWT